MVKHASMRFPVEASQHAENKELFHKKISVSFPDRGSMKITLHLMRVGFVEKPARNFSLTFSQALRRHAKRHLCLCLRMEALSLV